MLERQLFLPLAPEPLWDEMTSPDGLADWLGLDVDWQLEPGAPARFGDTGDNGDDREGVVVEVEPARRLCFRWWPVGGAEPASEVTWLLEPEADGTRLTVLERVVTTSATSALSANSVGLRWTPIDDRLLRLWARATTGMAAAAPTTTSGRR